MAVKTAAHRFFNISAARWNFPVRFLEPSKLDEMTL